MTKAFFMWTAKTDTSTILQLFSCSTQMSMKFVLLINVKMQKIVGILTFSGRLNEPHCVKTGLRGFRPGPTQTGLYSHRGWLEA